MIDDYLGGFFGLELGQVGNFPYPESERCAWVSSGRAALECLLRSMPRVARVWAPRFTCDTVLQPLQRMGLPVLRYELSRDWLPLLPEPARADDLLLLTNYFGFTGEAVAAAAAAHPGPCVVDATTALYAPPGDLPTFYSLRKFAGVPDGGVACAPFPICLPQEEDRSSARAAYLLQRIEVGAEAALPASERAETELSAPPRRMSPLTRALIGSIDWQRIAAARLRTYTALHAHLAPLNRLSLPAEAPSAPFCYPFVSGIPGLRDDLIDSGLALPLFWPEVIRDTSADSPANQLARQLLPIPLDQRYTAAEILPFFQFLLDIPGGQAYTAAVPTVGCPINRGMEQPGSSSGS